MILAIDFDGVIHDYQHPLPHRRMGAPVEGTAQALAHYKARGDTIYIYTIWPPTSHNVISDWMRYYNLPYDHITNVKQAADYYIDDKAVRFTNWVDTLGMTM